MNTKMQSLVYHLGACFQAKKWKLAVAESCTGGGLAYAITNVPGSSEWFDRGWVTYSNEAKIEELGVNRELFLYEGAVSEAVVRSMVEGVLKRSRADVGIAITGIAGPSGGSDEKPVGTVWIAWIIRSQRLQAEHFFFQGDRESIRYKAVRKALEGLSTILDCRQRII